ncbi:MAG: FoF1 ATP synthase subunit gamma [Myxococcota bacterium]
MASPRSICSSIGTYPVEGTDPRTSDCGPSSSHPSRTSKRKVLLGACPPSSLFRACAESAASEHGSRLSAMQAAERNLDERLESLTQVQRRARQDSITAELLDLVSGFEAAETNHERAAQGGHCGDSRV